MNLKIEEMLSFLRPPINLRIVKLRSRSRSGDGQVRVRRVRRVRFGPELYPIFGFHHPPPVTFFAFYGVLDMTDGLRKG